MVSNVVVTTPDDEIEKHINKKYQNNNKLILHKRSAELARLNIGLVSTVEKVFEDITKLGKAELFLTLAIRYPFSGTEVIDNAIRTLQIFDTDSLITVRADNNMFFQHTGKGMKPILGQNKFSKLEREDLFRYSGGIIVTKKSFFDANKEFIGGRIGHVIIDQFQSHFIQNTFDITVAELIKNEINKNALYKY